MTHANLTNENEFLTEKQKKVLKKDIFERKDYYVLGTIKNKCIKVLENYDLAKKILIQLTKK